MDNPLYVVDLFAGSCALGEGLRLGLRRPDARTVLVVEREAFACGYVAHQMEQGRLDPCPVFTDVRAVPGRVVDALRRLAGRAPLWFCAGFPCQDISQAGKGAGIKGEKSGLWFDLLGLIRDVRPGWLLLENVSAINVRGLDAVAGGLAKEGYDAAWDCFQAFEAGAPHKRERWFCVGRLADADGGGSLGGGGGAPGQGRHPVLAGDDLGEDVLPEFPPGRDDPEWERVARVRPDLLPVVDPEAELAVRSVANGLAPDPDARLDLCRLAGNGVVPRQAAIAVRLLLRQLEEHG
jgi:DNA (cytosine-5)-methyltransferase 1